MVLLAMVYPCLVAWSWRLSGKAVLAAGRQDPLCRADLAVDPDVGLLVFGARVRSLYSRVGESLHDVVVHRRDESIRSWRNWVWEDPLVHPYRWLQPDLVPPSPFVSCDPGITPGGSGVWSDPALIDEQFRNAWIPYFCRADRGVGDPSGFKRRSWRLAADSLGS